MAEYIVVHTPLDAKMYANDGMTALAKEIVPEFTADVFCKTTWSWGGGTCSLCLWEAPSEQDLIELFGAMEIQVPVNGIYPATVTDWAAARKQMGL